jgi:AmiR/NasT family two-component response regulator
MSDDVVLHIKDSHGASEDLTCALVAARAEADHLRRALESSRTIGAAMGIVMATHMVSLEEAFEMLREVSQNHNRKLRDIAVDVVEQGCLPDGQAW